MEFHNIVFLDGMALIVSTYRQGLVQIQFYTNKTLQVDSALIASKHPNRYYVVDSIITIQCQMTIFSVMILYSATTISLDAHVSPRLFFLLNVWGTHCNINTSAKYITFSKNVPYFR